MFNRIPTDVSEIVVVYSRCECVYRTMTEIVEKFNDKRVEERILDKLTKKTEGAACILYKLSQCHYRSYEKPHYLCKQVEEYYDVYRWPYDSRRTRLCRMPYNITIRGTRNYPGHNIYSGSDMYAYSFDNLIIYYSGRRSYVYNNYAYSILDRVY